MRAIEASIRCLLTRSGKPGGSLDRALPFHIRLGVPFRIGGVCLLISKFHLLPEPDVMSCGLMSATLPFGGIGPLAGASLELTRRPRGSINLHSVRSHLVQ